MEQRAIVAKVGERARQRLRDAVVHVSDVWVRLQPVDVGPMSQEEARDYFGTAPSGSFDSTEAIVAHVFSRDPSVTWIQAYCYQKDYGRCEVTHERHHTGGSHPGATAGPIQRALWGR
jgi:hypothetical protein